MTQSIVTPQNLICSKQRKGIFIFRKKTTTPSNQNTNKFRKWSNMWSCMIFTAVLGKEKSLEPFCFKAFSVVEATGLEPTTFWSLRHNRKFFNYFPRISKSFVSATDAFLYSCSHCFHVVQIRKWSNMWSFRLQVKNGCKKSKTTYLCTY